MIDWNEVLKDITKLIIILGIIILCPILCLLGAIGFPIYLIVKINDRYFN